MNVLQIGLGIAYPLLIFLALTRLEARQVGLVVLALAGLRAAIHGPSAFRKLARDLWRPALVLVLVVGATILWNDPLGLLLIPTLISCLLLATFALSLRGPQSMVERFARMQVDDLSREEIDYCRRVTLVWCAFFVANASLALVFALRQQLELWAAYTGFVAYLLMGLLFAGEYVYRHWRFRRYVGAVTDPLLSRIFPPRSSPDASSPRIERVEDGGGTRIVELVVPDELACWPGHFEDHAALPGVMLIEWAARQVKEWRPGEQSFARIDRLKFKRPIRPGDRLTLRLEGAGADAPIVFRYERQGEVVSSGRLVGPGAMADLEGASASGSTHASSEPNGLSGLQTVQTNIYAWPSVAALVPHGGAMLWLEEVVAHDARRTKCHVAARSVEPLLPGTGETKRPAGRELGAWWALEWMAQCVAAHDGLNRRDQLAGNSDSTKASDVTRIPPRTGLLLGSKRLVFHRPRLSIDDLFLVEAVHLWGSDDGMVSFDCRVEDRRDGSLVAEGQLICFVPAAGELATLLA